MKNYYHVLGIKPNASTEQIKHAYRRLSKQSHPDKSGDDKSYKIFIQINEAYQVLSDNNKRAEHDDQRLYDHSKKVKYLKKISLIMAFSSVAVLITIESIKGVFQNKYITTWIATPIEVLPDSLNKKESNLGKNDFLKKPIQLKAKENTRLPKKERGAMIDTTLNVERTNKNSILLPGKSALTPMSSQKMDELLVLIHSELDKNNNETRCIQIRKTNSSNVEDFDMLTSFLRKNSFIISGRESISGSINGTLIDATGACIKLTIGIL